MKHTGSRILIFAYIGLLGAVAAGCHLEQKYSRPVTELPQEYRDAPAPGDTVSIADISWRSFFTDPLLRELIDSAVNRNFDLLIALKNIETAQRLTLQARAGNWPQIDAQVTAGITRPSDNSLNGISTNQFLKSSHVEDYNAGLAISWEADIWGKIRSRKEAAWQGYLQTQEARKAIQTQVVSDVAHGFYNLLMLDEQIEIARENVLLEDSTLRILRLQFEAGQTNSLAIEQAVAQQQTAQLLIPQLEQEIAIQENALRILAGELPDTISRKMRLDDFEVPEHVSQGIPASLVRMRPDVRATENALQAANARVGIAQAEMYPSLVITAGVGVNSFKATNWFSIPASLFGLATGSLIQPLLHHRELKTAFEIAKIDREKQVLVFRQSVLVAVGEVSDALITIEKLRTQREISLARTDTLENATRNAALLFRSGMANYLEVISAQARYLQSQLDAADLRRQHLNSVVDLYRSLGGGWN